MKYAVILQQVALHATFVMKEGVVLEIQPDFVDLRGEGSCQHMQLNQIYWWCQLYRVLVPMDVPVGPAVAQAEGIDDEASSDDSEVANLCCFIDY